MTPPDQIILKMAGISKSFPGVKALENVDFDLRRGEIHALMGENGAGTSTLIKVLTGVEHPDSGVITLNGQMVQVRSPQHAQDLGISTVYQEINLCPNLTVAENILIGREPRRTGRIDWKAMNQRARRMLLRLDVDIDVQQTLGSYSVAIQQMAAIVRALEISSAKVLILDEPTSSLDAHETAKLFQVMRQLKGEGMAIIFITHFIDQVYEVSDRITVLRNGKLVGSYDTSALSLARIHLVGKSFISVHVALALLLLLVAMYLAHFTRFGRTVYAMGGSEQSARLMGLPVARTKVLVYTFSGFCSALAGIVFSINLLSGHGLYANGLELEAISSVVIGGTLLTGGVGYVFGTLFGVLINGLIQVLIMFNGELSSWWTRIVIGLLTLVFILVQSWIASYKKRQISVKSAASPLSTPRDGLAASD